MYLYLFFAYLYSSSGLLHSSLMSQTCSILKHIEWTSEFRAAAHLEHASCRGAMCSSHAVPFCCYMLDVLMSGGPRVVKVITGRKGGDYFSAASNHVPLRKYFAPNAISCWIGCRMDFKILAITLINLVFRCERHQKTSPFNVHFTWWANTGIVFSFDLWLFCDAEGK